MFQSTPKQRAASRADAKQRLLADTLVNNGWRLRRMRRVEAELWQTAYNTFTVKNIEVTSTCTSGDAFAIDCATFERLQRVVNSCERVYHRASQELERLQEVARAHGLRTPQPESGNVGQALSPANPELPSREPAPQPEQRRPTSESSASVRHNSKTPSSAAPNRRPPRLPARTPRQIPRKSGHRPSTAAKSRRTPHEDHPIPGQS